jgi:hypothetical protein
VFWEGAIFHHSEQLVAISHDGGVTFSKPIPAAAVNDIPDPLPGSSHWDDSFPSADVNQTNGDIYVTWANEQGSPATALIEFTQSDDGGTHWSTPMTIGGRAGAVNAYFPSVAASPDGHHVFVGWPAQTWAAPGTAPGAGVVSDFSAFNVRTKDMRRRQADEYGVRRSRRLEHECARGAVPRRLRHRGVEQLDGMDRVDRHAQRSPLRGGRRVPQRDRAEAEPRPSVSAGLARQDVRELRHLRRSGRLLNERPPGQPYG